MTDQDREREVEEREAALRRREAAIERARSQPVTFVPAGRIGGLVPRPSRGDYASIVDGRADLDAGLTRALRLPRPEKPPPNVSKCDK